MTGARVALGLVILLAVTACTPAEETTTTRTTTTRAQPSTTARSDDRADCQAMFGDASDLNEVMSISSAWTEAAFAQYNLEQAQEGYDTTIETMDELMQLYGTILSEDCERFVASHLRGSTKRLRSELVAARSNLRQICREDVGPFGFEC